MSTAVKLTAGAAVDGDRLYAAGLEPDGELRGVERGLIPAETHLGGHRDVDGLDHSRDDGFSQVRLAHQGRATGDSRHLPRRTAKVEIDDLSAGLDRQTRALRHGGGVLAHQLNDHEGQALADRRAPDDIGPSPGEFVRRHHLGGHIGRPQATGQTTERQIRHAGHRRDPNAPAHLHRTDLELFAHFIVTPTDRFLGNLCGAVKPGQHRPSA
jgi:hypothetical protein